MTESEDNCRLGLSSRVWPPPEPNEVLTESAVVALMRSSKNKQEWGDNCGRVKDALGGRYPGFWYKTIIRSGLINEVFGPVIGPGTKGLV